MMITRIPLGFGGVWELGDDVGLGSVMIDGV
jgi:hypothetical protein